VALRGLRAVTTPFLSWERWQPSMDALVTAAATYGIRLLLALAILAVGNWASHRIAGWTTHALHKVHTDATFVSLAGNVVKWGIRVATFVVALNQLGFATASVLAIMGTAGLAIGLALQGTLQNIAAGLMLLLWRPFRVGDFIESTGMATGTVEEISLFTTSLRRLNGTMVYISNSQLWTSPVVNYTAISMRRIGIELTLSWESDIEKALEVLRSMVGADPRVLNEGGAPWIAVEDYTDHGIRFGIGVWVPRTDYDNARADLLRLLKPTLEDAGFRFAYDGGSRFGGDECSR